MSYDDWKARNLSEESESNMGSESIMSAETRRLLNETDAYLREISEFMREDDSPQIRIVATQYMLSARMLDGTWVAATAHHVHDAACKLRDRIVLQGFRKRTA